MDNLAVGVLSPLQTITTSSSLWTRYHTSIYLSLILNLQVPKLDNYVKAGDNVLIYLTNKKKWLIRANADEKLHTHLGYIELASVIGKEYGSSI